MLKYDSKKLLTLLQRNPSCRVFSDECICYIDKLNPIYNKIRPKKHLLSFELNSYVIDKHLERVF